MHSILTAKKISPMFWKHHLICRVEILSSRIKVPGFSWFFWNLNATNNSCFSHLVQQKWLDVQFQKNQGCWRVFLEFRSQGRTDINTNFIVWNRHQNQTCQKKMEKNNRYLVSSRTAIRSFVVSDWRTKRLDQSDEIWYQNQTCQR